MKYSCKQCDFQWEGTSYTFDKVREHEKEHLEKRIETTKVYMDDREIIDMTKKLPHGHNIGGGNRQKRRQEFKKNKSNQN